MRKALLQPQKRRHSMSGNSTPATDESGATYLRPANPALADYYPAWLDALADDVTIEGSMMNGAIQGAEGVREVVVTIRSLYETQEFHFAGPFGEHGFIEDYTARIRGQVLGNYTVVIRDESGQTRHIVGNYRPRSALLLLSRLIGERFAGTPYADHFVTSEK
jgi:hypothetical protein